VLTTLPSAWTTRKRGGAPSFSLTPINAERRRWRRDVMIAGTVVSTGTPFFH
jgi:hypothetical protein